MSSTKRRNQIIALLQSNKTMEIEHIAETFHVTPTTIRRDLAILENEQLISRSRGKAHITDNLYYADFNIRTNINSEAKHKISVAAAGLIEPGSSIILDSGTTMLALARVLEKLAIVGVSVITSALPIALILAPKYQLMMPGGIIDVPSMALVGPDTESFFENIKVDTFFLCSTGVIDSRGLSAASPYHVRLKQHMIASASEVIAVLDPSKFSTSGINLVCEFSKIEKLVTIKTPENADKMEEIEKAGVEILLVD